MKSIMVSKNQNINDFIKRWINRGAEKRDTQKFWLDFLSVVLGLALPGEMIEFEKSVELEHNSSIDAYIPLTRVLIEQKSKNIPLDKVITQSDTNQLTPYQQAKRYSDGLPVSQRARWIVTCNFQEFWIYDMETPKASPEVIQLKNLDKEWSKLRFLVECKEDKQIEDENADLIVDASFYVKTITLHFIERCYRVWASLATGNRSPAPNRIVIRVRLDALFRHMSLRLTGRHNLHSFVNVVSSYQKGYDVDLQDALDVKNKYEQLGLIRDTFYGKSSVIELTVLGRKIMNELNPI